MPTHEELAFVEEAAVFMESFGLLRMAGRVFAWLMICDPPEQSAAELAEVLRASKGAISGATNLLVQGRLIDRVSLPGHRRDYFRVRPGGMTDRMRAGIAGLTAFREITERGLALLPDDPKRRERLQAIHDFYAWLERELPDLYERWERERPRAGGSR
jgi:MarR family